MKALDFIQSDMAKQKHTSAKYYVALFVIVMASSLVLGFALRDDHGSGLSLKSLLFSIAGLVVLFASLRLVLRGKFLSQKPLISLLLVSTLFFAVQTMLLDPVTVYPSEDIFWQETLACFLKGCLSTICVGVYLSFFAFRFTAWPTRSARLLLSLSSGLAGALMLEVHCDSSSFVHVVLGHLLQGVVSGLVVFGLMELLFIVNFRKTFSNLKDIKNIQKLG